MGIRVNPVRFPLIKVCRWLNINKKLTGLCILDT